MQHSGSPETGIQHRSGTRWKLKVLKLLCELELAEIHSLVSSNSYLDTAFVAISTGVFTNHQWYILKISSSTSSMIDLLKRVFEVCGVDANDLAFEMSVDAEHD